MSIIYPFEFKIAQMALKRKNREHGKIWQRKITPRNICSCWLILNTRLFLSINAHDVQEIK